ncbi:PLP-dependent cysteine synthase family protein [Desulfurococcaceae archaeon MEX13E-LK6-19]|nr:PLP-dependent cysteine synthase family protein [Desulfurococcaceae archaeon MEX13E-LK6-19]
MEERLKLKVFMNTLEMLPHIWPTPLVRLRTFSENGYEAWAKLEYFNPFSHSIKDRPVWNMIVKALKECVECGKLYEATSGNVGIAMACISNALGIKFRAYIPKPTPKLTETLLKMLGAEVIKTDYETISPEMVKMVEEIARKESALNLNQFVNDDNFEVHYKYTARELDEQLKAVERSPPRAIIAGIGTSGHIAAISKYFKEKYGDKVKIIGVIPAKGESIPGIKRIETRPKWIFQVKIDDVVEVTKEEAAKMAIEVARREGILIGLSSGAVTRAYEIVRNDIGEGVYVLVYPDDSFKYIETIEKYL